MSLSSFSMTLGRLLTMTVVAGALLGSGSVRAQEEIYKSVDAQGRVTYSDQPTVRSARKGAPHAQERG